MQILIAFIKFLIPTLIDREYLIYIKDYIKKEISHKKHLVLHTILKNVMRCKCN